VAIDAASRIAGYLAEQGFPEPIKADSGNGAHLLYRTDLLNTFCIHMNTLCIHA
jgi:hypothetical protein